MEEISFDSDRHRVWPERVRVAAGLLQTQPAQSLLPREGVDPGVRRAPRVIRVSPPGGVGFRKSVASSHDSKIRRRTCLSSTASMASRNHAMACGYLAARSSGSLLN